MSTKPILATRRAEPGDAAEIVTLVHELAAFERAAPDEVRLTEVDVMRDAFGERPLFGALLGEVDGAVMGCAIYHWNYSTWTAGRGMHIEDLYLRPAARGLGLGGLLLKALAGIGRAEGARRIDLYVLDWNPARNLYEHYGWRYRKEWLSYRLNGEALDALADSGLTQRPHA